jgi:hypothetical protein
MKRYYRESTPFKIIAGLTTAFFLALSVSTPVLAFDSILEGSEQSGRVIGLSLSGNFDFTNIKIAGFSHQPIDGMTGKSDSPSTSFFTVDDGVVKTQLPLVTIGENVRFPGILYNHNGPQFYEHIVNAASGEEQSQSKVGLYVLGVGAMGALIFAMASSGGGDDKAPAEPINGGVEDNSVTEDTAAEPVDEIVQEAVSLPDPTATPEPVPEDSATP